MARMQAIGDEIKAAEVALAELQAEIEDKALVFQTCQMILCQKAKMKMTMWKSQNGEHHQFDFEIKITPIWVSGWAVLSLKPQPN
jgi:seryl-tRNA synthetase